MSTANANSWFDDLDQPPIAAVTTETEIEAPGPARETAVDSDGFLYDVDTGEVLGRADLDDRFEIRDDDAAEWVLELRSKLEGDVIAIDARLKALGEMLRTLRAEKMRRLSWWDYRFSSRLTGYARTKLKGKGRTAVFAWGKVAFRASKGTNTIINMERAVAWMRTWAPERVKVVESVSVKDALASLELAKDATGEAPEVADWLVSSGPQESVTVTTGIDIQITKGGDS